VLDCDICRRDEHRLRMGDHVEAVLSAVAPHRRRWHSHIRHPLPPERTFGSAKHLGENIQSWPFLLYMKSKEILLTCLERLKDGQIDDASLNLPALSHSRTVGSE
jgi:hypothetical protein